MSLDSEVKYGLKVGTPEMRSIGPVAFGPEGILFVADNAGAMIFAIEVGDSTSTGDHGPVNVENLDTRLAAFLGCRREDVYIADIAVRPRSEDVYLSIMRGAGSAGVPVLVKVGGDGMLSEVSVENVAFSEVAIEDAPADDDPRLEVRLIQGAREGQEVESRSGVRIRLSRDSLRTVTVTDMAFVNGVLLVSGASNEEFSSTLRRIPFPFNGTGARNSLEIYHVSHARYETASPIRAFVPYARETSILASYTCTPVVHFPIEDLASGSRIKGRTVAELGAGNTPLDMVAYARDGEEYLLVSNARHPLMKIACQDIDRQEPLIQPSEPVGVPRVNLPHTGVSHMANLNGSHVLMLQQDEAGSFALRSYSCVTL